jgi:hypothetical protein
MDIGSDEQHGPAFPQGHQIYASVLKGQNVLVSSLDSANLANL